MTVKRKTEQQSLVFFRTMKSFQYNIGYNASNLNSIEEK